MSENQIAKADHADQSPAKNADQSAAKNADESPAENAGQSAVEDFDAIVVGAGFSGLYMLHSLRKMGLSVRVYEQGGGVGGTWYWNRYPGARCDSESVYYMFSDRMSEEEILDEWNWSERYAAQPEILRYLEFVTDKMDLRRDIQFNARIVAAVYDAEQNRWNIRLEDGTTSSARFLVTAVGCLSSTNTPDFPGLESFAGESYHTGAWPHEGVDFTGQRVAVIGTGATAVQAVPEIAKQAAHVWVFQRTPNYDIPGRNRPLATDYVAEVKAAYKDLWQKARESGFGLPYQVVERSVVYSPEERQPIFEAAWAKGGFYMGLETLSDYLVNKESNDTVSEFVRGKIREIVKDPAVGDLLAPKDHPFFTKRPPLENGYYETFNRDNVTLLDVRNAPIGEITPRGVRTGGREYEVDAIVYATGFDAMTGALFGMGITGRDGLRLRDKWEDGPRTYLGLTTHGFPNLFVITGPQSPSVLSNMPVAIEQNVAWIAGVIGYMRAHGLDVAEPPEDTWVEHHNEVAAATLLLGTDSWWVGANIPGKPRPLYPYVGGVGPFRAICQEVADKGYEGLVLSWHEAPAAAAAGG